MYRMGVRTAGYSTRENLLPSRSSNTAKLGLKLKLSAVFRASVVRINVRTSTRKT